MTTQVLLPKIGFSMSEGTLTEWLVADGTVVTEGQAIYALESDKSVQDIEAPAGGTIKFLVAPGESYPVGTVLAEIS